jgi:antitoxin (DNA-binding transcriptional repressor) of toxin-antitoxin stability system
MEQPDVITISKFKATCLAVLDQVKRTGRPVLVLKGGEPIAVIDPPPLPKKRESWLGSFKTQGKITGDIIAPAAAEKDWSIMNE